MELRDEKRAPLSNAKKQRRHRERRKAERERLRNQLLEAQEEIVRLKSSAGSEIEERTRLGSTPTYLPPNSHSGHSFFRSPAPAGTARNAGLWRGASANVRERAGTHPFQGWNTGSIPVGDANKSIT